MMISWAILVQMKSWLTKQDIIFTTDIILKGMKNLVLWHYTQRSINTTLQNPKTIQSSINLYNFDFDILEKVLRMPITEPTCI